MCGVRLPAAERAVVDTAKVRDYLLSADHPVGAAKAEVFRRLGYSQSDWRLLRNDLLALARTVDVIETSADQHGRAFAVSGTLTGPNGRDLIVTTVWFIRSTESWPRFVTAYPWRE